MRRILLVLLLASSLRAGLVNAAEPRRDPPAGKERKSAARRVVVDHFGGEGGQKRIRSEVTRMLDQEQSIDLISVELLDAHRTHDVSVDGSPEGYVEVAAKLGVVALIRGRVAKSEGRQVLSLVVINGHDGHRLGRVELKADSLKELREKVGTELWRELEPVIVQAGPQEERAKPVGDAGGATEEETETEEEEAPPNPYRRRDGELAEPPKRSEPAPPPEPPARAARDCTWLEIQPRGGTITRSFSYENERNGALRAYALERSPVAALELTAYPGALAGCGLAAGIGLRLGYEQMFGVTSHVADRDLETQGSSAGAELVFRVPIGPLQLEPAVGYHRRHFAVERSYVPDVTYQSLSGGLKVDLRLGVFIAEARGRALFVLHSGQLQSDPWFPAASGLGFDASLLLGVAPLRWLDVFVSAGVERYAFDLNQSEPIDASVPPVRANGVADKVHDHFTTFGLGLRFRLSKGGRNR